MPDGNETIVKPTPDPTVLTREASDRAKEAADMVDTLRDQASQRELVLRAEARHEGSLALKELFETQLRDGVEMSAERVASIRREIDIREDYRRELKADSETHRLELKSDGEKTLTTATIAAEKAVQAALAAAEKARDQQTIASQLATTKAEEASKERQDQQGETFTTGIAGLASGFNDVKLQLSELRAEKRGNQEQVVVQRDTAADMKPIIDAIAELTKAQTMAMGSKAQIVESQSKGNNIGMWIGVGVAAIIGFVSLMLGVVDLAMKLRP